jgi:hypothetical protein
MMETQVRINITHFPNGDEVPEMGNHILHLMPDGSVIGCPFGPTIITGGKRIKDYVKFEWYSDRPDVAGSLYIDEVSFSTSVGCGYSGSSYSQKFPEYKKDAIKKWISQFPS